MFPEIKAIVDVLREGASLFSTVKSRRERREAIHKLLRTYFILMDCVDEAEALLADAGPDPAARICSMNSADAGLTLERWDLALRVQTSRLYTLAGEVLGQEFLAVVSPELQQQIDDIAGSKMDHNLTLSGIVAALFMRSVFDLKNTPEGIASYVCLMAGMKDGQLDMATIAADVADLRTSLKSYRAVVERLASNDEIMKLSKEARKEADGWPKVYNRASRLAATAPPRKEA